VQLGCAEGLPAAVTDELLQEDAFLQRFHHALLEVGCQLLTGDCHLTAMTCNMRWTLQPAMDIQIDRIE
jgi:hypothetical protein